MARLVYLGTPELAVPPLRALVGAGHDVALVVSRADRRRGRGSDVGPSPVKRAAAELDLPVTADLEEATGVGAELGVVVAYGRLIPPSVLGRLPMVNLHFSLLPRWRGAAPVERAILAGDPVTGVCVMAVEEGLDTGAVYASAEVPIGDGDDLEGLRGRLVEAGTALLLEVVAGGAAGLPEPVPQRGEATYAEKIDPAELRLDLARPAVEVARVVRLGRAFTTFRGKRLRVLEARPLAGGEAPGTEAGAPGTLAGTRVATGDGQLELGTVQPEGRRPLAAADWVRGARPAPGERLGD